VQGQGRVQQPLRGLLKRQILLQGQFLPLQLQLHQSATATESATATANCSSTDCIVNFACPLAHFSFHRA